jgi:hypothetical protein
MPLPKPGTNYAQERVGIAAVQTYAARAQQIWRETGTGDVGIDGNLEFVSADGFATGRLVAVQVKSGPSFFANPTTHGWKFYPEEKHRLYWESFPVPVLLVLHDPATGLSYWSDVCQALRAPSREEKAYLEVPSYNVLERTLATQLFETAGAQEQPFIEDMEVVLQKLLNTRSRDAGFPLSHFDLFAHGLTNICRNLYYGMDLVTNVVEYNLTMEASEFSMGMGADEHRFLFDFVKFLLAQGLAQIDYSDCLIDWVERQMQPHFVAPLTSRGRKLVELIEARERAFVAAGTMPDGAGIHVGQEGFFHMVEYTYFRKMPLVRAFQAAARS